MVSYRNRVLDTLQHRIGWLLALLWLDLLLLANVAQALDRLWGLG